MPIELITGDITEQEVDAIVNSANPSLLAGGGVCGAIHRAAGPELEPACRVFGGCTIGNAVITQGFNLKAQYVIHAVSARWYGGNAGELALLEKCYRSIFELVKREKLKSVAIPAIGTGIYHIPIEQATLVAVTVALEYEALLDNVLIRFVCIDTDSTLEYFAELIFREGFDFRYTIALDKVAS